MIPTHDNKVFKPRPSSGWVWVTAIGLILSGTGLGVGLNFGFGGPFLPMILIATTIGIGFLVIAAFFPSMRYEVGDSRLRLSYGPLLRYTIEIDQIRSVRHRDLGFSPISSFRFPGLALFSVPYPEIGIVRMCATATSTGILMIETAEAKYGLTPADEQAFVAELRKRIGP